MKTMTLMTTMKNCIPHFQNANEQAMVQLFEFLCNFFAPSDTNCYAIRQLFQFCTHNVNAM